LLNLLQFPALVRQLKFLRKLQELLLSLPQFLVVLQPKSLHKLQELLLHKPQELLPSIQRRLGMDPTLKTDSFSSRIRSLT